jgi:hypothetical protein
MTLNIAVATRKVLALSSDFRLTQAGSGHPLSDSEQKLFVLHYQRWSGLLCYTGVAKYRYHDTGRWLKDVLTHPRGERSPDSILNILVQDGSAWLRRMPEGTCHTFTLVVFLKGVPHVYTVSNFQWADGHFFEKPLDTFKVAPARTKTQRITRTGWSQAITEAQVQRLEAQASALSLKDLRYAVACTNRDAASRSKGTVSENCVVAHLLSDGSGELEVFGNLQSPFVPTLISRGANTAEFLRLAAQQAGEIGHHRLVGTTWSANEVATSMLLAYRLLSAQTGDGWPVDRAPW